MNQIRSILSNKFSIVAAAFFILCLGVIPNTNQSPAKQLAANLITSIKKSYYTLKKLDKKTSLYLSSTIGNANDYEELVPFFFELEKDDVVTIYLKGTGGSVSGLQLLTMLIHGTKATVNVVVYGDVYSAHATLALQGKELVVVDPNIRFLFHIPATGDGRAVTPDLCINTLGVDRGQSARVKCEIYIKNLLAEWNEILAVKFPLVMTTKDYLAYLQGWDVWVRGDDVVKRFYGSTQ